MNSIRLKTIASFIEKEDKVVDVGCDHAYLAIYLMKQELCQNVIATDINQNALKIAENHIKKEGLEEKIPTILSDGLKNVDQNVINTVVISGMGTATILHILENVLKERIKKIIIQSNNDLSRLQKKKKKKGYYLQQEKVVFEKGHYYVIGIYTTEKNKMKKRELYFGIFSKENIFYYEYLWKEYQNINKKISYKHIKKKIKVLYQMHLLKKYVLFVVFKEKM